MHCQALFKIRYKVEENRYINRCMYTEYIHIYVWVFIYRFLYQTTQFTLCMSQRPEMQFYNTKNIGDLDSCSRSKFY